ncbi:hypothetical protein UFOVP1290_118 [uncultured Caudovirales phage]|uniref:Uncharacterized protein n=1 Tax=uncultured Caudovirales phage TaxID=2100421 RepID=A0A6J5RSE5_9CAUD|nr:hypothetical protein UFOVP1290_118 [uncultured Caudovirales phage]
MEAISYYWAIVPAVLSGLIWGRMAQNKSNLIYSSVVFDVTLSISYVVALRYFGERLSPMQCVGALVSIFGIFLIGRG